MANLRTNLLKVLGRIFEPKSSKKCSGCGQIKCFEDFHYSRVRKQYVAKCRECVNNYTKDRYWNLPGARERQINFSKKRYENMKKLVGDKND